MKLSPDSVSQLLTYAQLGVAFAGFAGVIGAFSRFRIHPEATAFRVRAMVAIALMEVACSLAPAMIAGFATSEIVAWRVSSGLAAFAGITLMIVLARQSRVLFRTDKLDTKVSFYPLVSAYTLVTLPLFATALGFAERYTVAVYFGQLFFGMLLCSFYFIMLMIAVKLDDK